MSDALSDLTQEVEPNYISRRADDWVRRVGELYDLLESWLPDDCHPSRARTVQMHEEPMQRYGIPSREIPILDVTRRDAPYLRVIPRGLWIIGTNGRLDVIAPKGNFIIINRSHAFMEPSWHIASLANRRDIEPLTESAFRSML